LRLEPGAYNVIPRTACVALEFRSSDPHALDELEGALLARASSEAAHRGLELEVTPVGRWEPTPLDPDIGDAIEAAAAALGLPALTRRTRSVSVANSPIANAIACRPTNREV